MYSLNKADLLSTFVRTSTRNNLFSWHEETGLSVPLMYWSAMICSAGVFPARPFQ